ncbi:MAG: hypothetical protein ACR2NU_10045, partial [Aeoliella sp.]
MTVFRGVAPLARCGSQYFYLLVPAVIALAAATALSSTARAQVTAKTLIGDAVKDTGAARYSDIGEAIKRFSNNDPLGARKFLETAKQKDPKLPPVDLMMAKMYFLSGQSQPGLQSLERTVRDAPG